MTHYDAQIRLAHRDDLPRIVAIYNQAIASGTATGHTEPLTVEEREEWFNRHHLDHYPLYVIIQSNSVIGFGYLSPYRTGRKAMTHIAEISFYLDIAFHGKGLGSHLVQYIIADCTRLGISVLLAILLDCNAASIRLLEKNKFEKWGQIPKVIHLNKKRVGQFLYGRVLSNSAFG